MLREVVQTRQFLDHTDADEVTNEVFVVLAVEEDLCILVEAKEEFPPGSRALRPKQAVTHLPERTNRESAEKITVVFPRNVFGQLVGKRADSFDVSGLHTEHLLQEQARERPAASAG